MMTKICYFFAQAVCVFFCALSFSDTASADELYQPYKIESSPPSATSLDGEWITENRLYPPDAWGWGFRISGDIGELTMTYRPNDPKKKVGDVILRITRKTSTTFSGDLTCYDGNLYPVNGVLLQDGRLAMQVSGGCYPTNWTMVRKQKVIESTQPRIHITASALGQSAQEGGKLELEVPDNIGIEVEFRAMIRDLNALSRIGQTKSPPLTTGLFEYLWHVSDGTVVKGQPWIRKFTPGTYKVQVSLVDQNTTKTSTPALIPQKDNPQVTVTVRKNEKWGCLGRVGVQCGGYKNDWFANLEYSLTQGCENKPGNFCISSMVSVGSIKHDRCCWENNNNGFLCGGETSIEISAIDKGFTTQTTTPAFVPKKWPVRMNSSLH